MVFPSEALAFDHPTDETEPDDIFDLKAELATLEDEEDELVDDDEQSEEQRLQVWQTKV